MPSLRFVRFVALASVLLCSAALAADPGPVAVHPAGTGTRDDPFQIDSLPNLYWLSQDLSLIHI